MQDILDSFYDDLDDIENTFNVLKCTSDLRTINLPETPNEDSEIEKKSIELHGLIDGGRNGLVKIPGIFILYIGGRFEDYVKTLFEESSIQFANTYDDFESLPTKFKNSLISDTSTVISSPRKYGIRERTVNKYIEVLSKNVNGNDFTDINYSCLSKTESNMRPDILSDLFSKIAIKELWKEVGIHANVRTHFSTQDPNFAQTEAKTCLENFMKQRNQIAHPSGGSMTWPSYGDVENHISFLKVLGKVLLEICEMKIASLSSTT